MAGTSGASDLGEGDKFERGSQTIPWVGYSAVEVVDIDAQAHTARLRLQHVARQREPRELEGIFGRVFGGVPVDGGGFVVVGGRVVPVPPWDPTIRILEQIAVYNESSHIGDATLQEAVRRNALEKISAHAAASLEKLQVFESPPRGAADVHRHEHEREHAGVR